MPTKPRHTRKAVHTLAQAISALLPSPGSSA